MCGVPSLLGFRLALVVGEPSAGDDVEVGPLASKAHFDRVPGKNLIISGGENVYPAEIEAVLQSFDGVSACVVIGVPDEKWGEVGKVVIVVDP
ncbi:hypothetical protein [Saccharopolyspora sp. ASAGF58]|uniref:AMP-binding enzyme n=1 Tax=Saccharopolyspora sp. ASAGF58 TaxID=2719023 RepID=UPI0014453878|nr:hypothetical protein [Saccharopolyspora sp. ASAGF58]